MATNETLKDLNIDVNAKLDNTSEVKINMKKFFDETEVTTETEAALNPLLEDIKNDSKFDERLESTVNKSHVTALLEAMKAKLDSDGYKSVYQNYGHTITFAVQSALRIMGFNLPKENIDGEYGPETGDAVEAFQKWKGLTPDRDAGPLTLAEMLKVTLEAKYDGSVAPVTAKTEGDNVEVGKDFYTNNTVAREKTLGEVVNKVYVVEKIEDVPTTIQENTIIEIGDFHFFSNGKVYEYSKDGNSIIRRGNRSELDATGKWKEAVEAPVNTEIEDLEAELPKVQYDLVKKEILDHATLPKYYENKVSGAKGNPYLSLKTDTFPVRIVTLNVSLYIDAEGVVDTKKFLADAKKESDKLIADETADKNYKASLEKEIVILRKKAYGFIDLFTKEEIAVMPKKIKIAYTNFFSMFNNEGGAKIDIAGTAYTKFTDANKSSIQIGLDFDNDKDTQKLDKIDATNKNEFPVKDKENGLFDEAGKLREENLKKALKTIAKKIVEDPANGFVNA